MSGIVDLDREIEVLRKMLVKLRRQRDSKMKVAKLQVQIQKTKMEGRMPELLTTPFIRELRKLLIKAAENRFLAEMRKGLVESANVREERLRHPNQLVI